MSSFVFKLSLVFISLLIGFSLNATRAASAAVADADPPGLTADLGSNWAVVLDRIRHLGQVDSSEVRAWIEIPRVQVSGPILEGVDDVTIRRGIGHFPETPWPGRPGNVALAAHRTTHFRGLRDIHLGDSIHLEMPGRSYDYCVERMMIVDPSDVWVLRPDGGQTLTLITCYPFDYRGSAPERLVVRAVAVDCESEPSFPRPFPPGHD